MILIILPELKPTSKAASECPQFMLVNFPKIAIFRCVTVVRRVGGYFQETDPVASRCPNYKL